MLEMKNKITENNTLLDGFYINLDRRGKEH